MIRQKGISLIELMVALIISTLLILGVLQLFLNTSNSDRVNNALARVQENGRIALELIGADARRAGFQGCIASRVVTEIENGIKLPDHAVSRGNNAVTFRYAVLDSSAGPALPDDGDTLARSCTGTAQTYYLRTAAYTNCGGNLCLNGSAILNGAQITGMSYAIPDSNKMIWKANPTDEEIAIAKAVRVNLQVSNASQNITRDLSGTFELRNRTQ